MELLTTVCYIFEIGIVISGDEINKPGDNCEFENKQISLSVGCWNFQESIFFKKKKKLLKRRYLLEL